MWCLDCLVKVSTTSVLILTPIKHARTSLVAQGRITQGYIASFGLSVLVPLQHLHSTNGVGNGLRDSSESYMKQSAKGVFVLRMV